MKKRALSLFLAFALLITLFFGCTENKPSDHLLNGFDLAEYTIIYAADDSDYTERAAKYLADRIKEKTDIKLAVKSDKEQSKTLSHEIVVGNTKRDISKKLNEEIYGFDFSLMADASHVAMEANQFVIAAAAYYFIETYIDDKPFSATIPKKATVCEPITKKAKNYILMIGDGMGVCQTLLFDAFSAKDFETQSDGESRFYGYMFPYQGKARTDSLSGVTDSAAAGTALATGYKTINGYVGKDGDLKDIKSLTELAAEKGMATAVLSTESSTGATPAAFSAHAPSRNDAEDILEQQKELTKKNGTLILGDYSSDYSADTILNKVEKDLNETLKTLSKDKEGFFMMYEEAYIDKHSHANEMENTFLAVVRFNQIIGCVMEYAFYNPETFVLITADHETGGLSINADGGFSYSSAGHTNEDVPVFAYGIGSEVFDGLTIENIQIPKTIAAMMGIELKAYENELYPSLIPAK